MRMIWRRYISHTKRFYYSLFFILPFLFIYEYGLFRGVLGDKINGADALLRLFFYFVSSMIGSQLATVTFALILIVLFLSVIIYLIKNKIRIKLSFLLAMFFESAILGFFVAVVVHFLLNYRLPIFFTFQPNPGVIEQLTIIGLETFWEKIVASIGAGVFEELVFRVMLIRFLYEFLKNPIYKTFGYDRKALWRSVIVSSIIFTLMHVGSVGALGGLFSIFLGSLIFSGIYLQRGYGVTAATHIFFDIYLMFGIIA